MAIATYGNKTQRCILTLKTAIFHCPSSDAATRLDNFIHPWASDASDVQKINDTEPSDMEGRTYEFLVCKHAYCSTPLEIVGKRKGGREE